MKFLYPSLLFLTIPFIILFLFLKNRAKSCNINPKLIINITKTDEKLLIFVAIFIIIALSRPVIEKNITKTKSTVPLFIAIDVSNSMMAQDIKPNRFLKAKKLAKEIIKNSHKSAIIIFSSNPLLVAPPTVDKEMLYQTLELIEPKNILTKGTNFQRLLNFVERFEGKKELIIISDGGDFKNLKIPKNINLYAIATGTKSGALIPTDGGYLKNGGKMVVTKINQNFLKIAKAYGINDIGDILNHIEKNHTKSLKKEYVELFAIFIIFSLILLLFIYTTIFEKIKKLLPFMVVITLNASIIDEIKLLQGYKEYQDKNYKKALGYFDEKSLQSSFAKGVTLIKLRQYPKAIEILKELRSKDKNIKSKIYQNLGYSYEQIRKYDKAREFYIKAMQLTPSKDILEKLSNIIFLKNPKKESLPFAKHKIRNQKSKSKQDKNVKTKGSNLSISAKAGAKGDKKSKSASINRTKAMPLSSKVYELINKGYIDEKHPW